MVKIIIYTGLSLSFDEAKEIVIDITAKKGTNTLVITAVDAAGNTETLKKIYKGVSDPEIEVYREGEYL